MLRSSLHILSSKERVSYLSGTAETRPGPSVYLNLMCLTFFQKVRKWQNKDPNGWGMCHRVRKAKQKSYSPQSVKNTEKTHIRLLCNVW